MPDNDQVPFQGNNPAGPMPGMLTYSPAQFSARQFVPKRPEGAISRWIDRGGDQIKSYLVDMLKHPEYLPGTGNLGGMAKPFFTPALINTLKQLHGQGKGLVETANLLGASHDTVGRQAKKLGLGFAMNRQKWTQDKYNNIQGMMDQGLTTDEIASKLGTTRGNLYKVINKFERPPDIPRQFSPDEKGALTDNITRLLGSSINEYSPTQRDIAKQLGVSLGTVQRIINKEGLPTDPSRAGQFKPADTAPSVPSMPNLNLPPPETGDYSAEGKAISDWFSRTQQ